MSSPALASTFTHFYYTYHVADAHLDLCEGRPICGNLSNYDGTPDTPVNNPDSGRYRSLLTIYLMHTGIDPAPAAGQTIDFAPYRYSTGLWYYQGFAGGWWPDESSWLTLTFDDEQNIVAWHGAFVEAPSYDGINISSSPWVHSEFPDTPVYDFVRPMVNFKSLTSRPGYWTKDAVYYDYGGEMAPVPIPAAGLMLGWVFLSGLSYATCKWKARL